MSIPLKTSQVKKDVETAKNAEARDLGIQDFFSKRDKSIRKVSGLVEEAQQVLTEEGDIKQKLYDNSLKVNSLPDYVRPLFNGIFLTARRNKLMENGIYLPTASFGKGTDTDIDNDFSEKQIVLAKGKNVMEVETGMEVVLNMDAFKKRLERTVAQKLNKEFELEIPLQIIDGIEYIYCTERDLKYISNTNGIINRNQ